MHALNFKNRCQRPLHRLDKNQLTVLIQRRGLKCSQNGPLYISRFPRFHEHSYCRYGQSNLVMIVSICSSLARASLGNCESSASFFPSCFPLLFDFPLHQKTYVDGQTHLDQHFIPNSAVFGTHYCSKNSQEHKIGIFKAKFDNSKPFRQLPAAF